MLIFAEAVDLALQRQKKAVTIHEVYDAARSYLQATKLPDLQSDASHEEYGRLTNAWEWLQEQIVTKSLRNVFLVDKADSPAQQMVASVLQKLQDFRFIHVVAKDTTAANRDLATRRYQAYAIDLGAYSSRLKGKNIKARPGKAEKDLSFREIDISQMDSEGRRDAIRLGVVVELADFEAALAGVKSPPNNPTASVAAKQPAQAQRTLDV